MATMQRAHMIPAYFRRIPEGFEPLDLARSDWSADQLHGVAISGLLATAAEDTLTELGRADFVPARFHVDLFRPSRATTTTTRVEVVRSSNRLTLVDIGLWQGEEKTARASALFLAPSENPAGEIWEPSDRGTPPPLDIAPLSDEPAAPVIASTKPWSRHFAEHQNGGRRSIWHTMVPVILDEPASTFQAVAACADTASMVTNWGSAGVAHINTDISLTLARRPSGLGIGMRTLDHVQYDGIAVSTAEVFDRTGPLGTASVTALANARRTIDFSG